MPKAYVAMRDAFKADGLSDKQAKAKAAAIYNSKHKGAPVTNHEESVMTRLTRADIRSLFESDPPSKGGLNKKVGQWQDLDAAIRRAVSARKPGQPKPAPEQVTFTRTDLQGGRAVTRHGKTDIFSVASELRGAKEGHASTPTGVVVYKKHESINSYYNQLKESCIQYLNDEVIVKPAINSSVEDTPYYKQLKEAWWCGTCNSNEDTMTGDIGSVAMPFVAPGGDDPEEKKRRKRRKLGVVLAAATGSVQGTGN